MVVSFSKATNDNSTLITIRMQCGQFTVKKQCGQFAEKKCMQITVCSVKIYTVFAGFLCVPWENVCRIQCENVCREKAMFTECSFLVYRGKMCTCVLVCCVCREKAMWAVFALCAVEKCIQVFAVCML